MRFCSGTSSPHIRRPSILQGLYEYFTSFRTPCVCQCYLCISNKPPLPIVYMLGINFLLVTSAPYIRSEPRLAQIYLNYINSNLLHICHVCHIFQVVCWKEQPRIMTMSPLYPCGKPCSRGTRHETVKNLALFSSIINRIMKESWLRISISWECFQFFNRIENSITFYTLTIVIHKSRDLIGTGGIAKFVPK